MSYYNKITGTENFNIINSMRSIAGNVSDSELEKEIKIIADEIWTSANDPRKSNHLECRKYLNKANYSEVQLRLDIRRDLRSGLGIHYVNFAPDPQQPGPQHISEIRDGFQAIDESVKNESIQKEMAKIKNKADNDINNPLVLATAKAMAAISAKNKIE